MTSDTVSAALRTWFRTTWRRLRHKTPPKKKHEEPKKSWKSKRLFRNMDEKVLGGVCAGLGAYFGIDKALFRILFLIFSVLGIFGDTYIGIFPIPILYAILWIAMPAARTADQKREMKGKPTNMESYRNSDFDFKTEVKEAAHSPAAQTFIRIGGVFLGILLLIAGFGGMIGGFVIPSISDLVSHEIAEEISEWGPLDEKEQMVADLLTNDILWHFIIVIIGIMFVWFIYNGIMLIFDLKYPSWKPGLIIFIAWIISIFVFAGYVAKTAADAIGNYIMFL
jgi:phage shock protein PspC (stress-responsive transcriptional regulator)